VQKFPVEENFINFVKEMFNRRNKILGNFGKRVYELTPDEIYGLWKTSKNLVTIRPG